MGKKYRYIDILQENIDKNIDIFRFDIYRYIDILTKNIEIEVFNLL